jgi:predicted O-methyltransferase YrrM
MGLASTRVGRRAYLGGYRYPFTPEQLWALCEAATQASRLAGSFAEIGVAAGDTTLYLNRHLKTLGPLPRYFCVDTFSGFTHADIAAERGRGKSDDYDSWFRLNSRRLFERTMAAHGLAATVAVIEGDAAVFDYAKLAPLAFALVDVDLLRPVRAALEGCWTYLVPGGIMITDDCQPVTHTWDGARQAYVEFCHDHGLPEDVRHGKLGFSQKPW